MRTVAKTCGVALGSLYNYYPSKDDLMIATIESVWQDIFNVKRDFKTSLSFLEHVNWIFESVQQGAKEYPNFFTAHSISFATSGKNKARETMEHYFSDMKAVMLETLRADSSIKREVFSITFTETDFIDFVLTNILMLLLQHKEDCAVLLEIIRHTVY